MMGCELCDQIGGTLLWQNSFCRVVLVPDEHYPGFCRVIWKQHIKEMSDLNAEQQHHLMTVVLGVETAIRASLKPDKINLASLGNLTPHLHWHVIPRFIQDAHFPQPIWGLVQRDGNLNHPLDWQSCLIKNISVKLGASG